MSEDWGYTEENGPATWAEKYPLAAGKRQSPVDIDTTIVQSDTALEDTALTWNYGCNHAYRIVNTGYGWRVDVNGEQTELKGGPLNGVYKLEQFHCHWGSSCDHGSEHTVDGKPYAAELHLVHWNCEKYETFTEAASKPDGLAVLGVFMQVDECGEEEEAIEKIVSLIPNIEHKGQSAEIDFDIDLNCLIPDRPHYWTYLGSLTTPPCNESVIWIVFKEELKITEEQLNVFRNLKVVSSDEPVDPDEHQLIRNYRPPLPLGNRILRECGSI